MSIARTFIYTKLMIYSIYTIISKILDQYMDFHTQPLPLCVQKLFHGKKQKTIIYDYNDLVDYNTFQ